MEKDLELSEETLALVNAELEKQKKGEDEEAKKKADEEKETLLKEKEELLGQVASKDKKIAELTKIVVSYMRGNAVKAADTSEKEIIGYKFPNSKIGPIYKK